MLLFDVIPGSGVGSLVPALLTGATEETGKALALLIVLGSPRYRWQLNGLLFGAAVGAGFAGFESAGYALGAALGQRSVAAALDSSRCGPCSRRGATSSGPRWSGPRCGV